ncbi:MAG: glycosyltransferase [Elusimicrobia bacterium]|nr:glycosyltransferase [Elusimicrobiota bacterium]
MRIVHFTSAHPPTDNRIYYKEITSLAASGYETYLVAPSSSCEETTLNGATTITITRAKTRFGRFFMTTFRIFHKAWQLNGDLYHFHDPDLIPFGMLLKVLGGKVVIDIHENYPGDVLAKEWIPRPLRPLIALIMQLALKLSVKIFDGTVTADDELREKFTTLSGAKVVSAHNYPNIGPELLGAAISRQRYANRRILFLGGASLKRCFPEFVDALELIREESFAAIIGGNHNDQALLDTCKLRAYWSKVEYIGSVPFGTVIQRMLDASISINLFSDCPNHYDIRSNRLFEAMAAGLPVVVPNFPKWEAFIKRHECGIAVDPHDPVKISKAIKTLLADPELCVWYASNARQAALENYRWETQASKIKQLYGQILHDQPGRP